MRFIINKKHANENTMISDQILLWSQVKK